ncbi:zonular occludens toxin domain-containing protein [uncultured Oxalicibacterium sp.]|uniref:zonular occludens toxin domain-containing protein n=1 Tax=uncultured Oxalicibacterium sp. TaxID=1168540 RepID=UPI0025FE62B0|nr:zonular occludens toxin domain-containing protein [uncultured Oxalicibacterium sp.]
MAVYAITGKLGSGKGKGGMQRLRQYLRDGKRVATNCDVFLEHMLPKHSKATVIRVPDKPSVADLYAIGSGNQYIDFQPVMSYDDIGYHFIAPEPKLLKGFDEAHNGALVLDELASWFNTRTFNDKGRAELLEWFIHARKYGWDIFFICQNINQVDKQLRESLFEYVVRMTRLDRLKIPVVSNGLKLMTAGATNGTMPRVHIGTVRLGTNPDALVADRWVFRGDDLNDAYNTTQVFSDTYPHAIHCHLPNWHREGHKYPEPVPIGIRVARHLGFMQEPRPAPAPRLKSNQVRDLIMQLPPGERIKHFKRAQANGLI